MKRTAPANDPGPLAEDVYCEKTAGMRRKFTLQGDRLIIEVRRGYRGEIRRPISLLAVDPVYGCDRRRNVWGPAGFILGVVFVALTLPSVFTPRQKDSSFVILWGAISAAVCFWVGIRKWPKVEYYVFQGIGGGVAFDIARRGPDRDRFEQFVGKIAERIKSLQQQGNVTTE